MRRTRTVLLALVIGGGALLAGCGMPQSRSAPTSTSCWGTPVADDIVSAFNGTGQQGWALTIAYRESRCDPGARNRSGAVGLFQLVGHDDLLARVCPSFPPSVSGTDAHCNARAARLLYDMAGRSPWGG